MVSLGACKLFDGLSATELNTLRGLCRVESFPAGHEIFREADPGEAVYVIRAGSVEILAQVSGDKREVVSRLGPGDFFGEMAVIEFKPRSAKRGIDGDRSSAVESQIVVLVVAGSNPVGHPTLF